MKKLIILAIIIGAGLIITGGIILAVALKNQSNKGNESITNSYEITEAFSDISVDVDISDIYFYSSTDGKTKVECVEKEKFKHTVKVEDNKLVITNKDTRKWYERMFVFGLNNLKVNIYLPNNEYNDLSIIASTGNINLNEGFTFNNVNIKVSTGNVILSSTGKELVKVESSTGNIQVKGFDTKELKLEASTGKIIIENVNVSGKCYLKTSTGSKVVTNLNALNFECKSSTGKTTLTNVIIEEEMKVEASTGDIILSECDAKTVTIETSTGDVTGSFKTTKVFYCKSDTGRIDVPKSNEGGIVSVETDTGDIKLTISNND